MALASCATDPKSGQPSFRETFASDDPCSNNARNIGLAGGALAGALLGAALTRDKGKGALVGAVAGAAVGGLVGHSMDGRRCEIARLSTQYGMDVTLTAFDTAPPPAVASGVPASPSPRDASPKSASTALLISVRDSGLQFASDSALLSPQAAEYFAKVAAQYSVAAQSAALQQRSAAVDRAAAADVEALKSKRLLLVGHTDDTGSSAHNAELSEQRARAVGEVFRAAGVADTAIFYQGAGETLPIADNRSDEGRARNRRVEIVDLGDESALRAYLAQRTVNSAYYRPGQRTAPATLAAPADRSSPRSNPEPGSAARVARAAPGAPEAGRAGDRATGTPLPGPAASKTGPREPPAASPPSRADALALDFGGAPSSQMRGGVDVGSLLPESAGFPFTSIAQAAPSGLPSCAEDRPRVSHGVKSLRDQREISFTDYLPGLYGTTWSEVLNGHLVAVSNVAVFRDGGQPAARPTVLVYRDYQGDTSAKADYKGVGEVNTYRGAKGLLYRVFAGGPVSCMDIVLPYRGEHQALDSQLFYVRSATAYVVPFRPTSPAR